MLLHARAEQSAGANTSVTRAEFDQIVARTVSDLRDDGSEQLTSNLSRAARDRLVLLSTPDDGSLIRYDIRQLQEFFAAEQLYSGVQSHDLPARMSLVAGDAHWREVLHFSLSALVEQNRVTEVMLAARVLEELDGRVDETRTLRRRLARGAIAAARLMREGGLEQDRRLRNAFETTIDALTGWCNAGAIQFLNAPEQSRRWLLNLMWSRLSEVDTSEAAGAWLLLICGTTRAEPRCHLILEKFLNSPLGLQVAVLELLAGAEECTPLLGPLGLLLNSGAWRSLGERAIEALSMTVTRLGEEMFEDGGEERDPELEILRVFTERRIDCGAPHESIESPTFTLNRYTRDQVINALTAWSEGTAFVLAGFNAQILPLFEWFETRDLAGYRSLASQMHQHEAAYRVLLGSVFDAVYPSSRSFEASATEAEFDAMLEEWLRQPAYHDIQYKGPAERLTLVEFRSILEALPVWLSNSRWFAGVVISIDRDMLPDNFVAEEAFSAFAAEVMKDPTFLELCPHLWGDILEALRPNTDLRDRVFAEMRPGEQAGWTPSLVPFELQLPRDTMMLPFVCSGLQQHLTRRGTLTSSREFVVAFGLSQDSLIDVLRTTTTSHSKVSASLILLLLTGNISHVMDSGVLEAETNEKEWALPLLTDFLSQLGLCNSEPAQLIMSKLLDGVRGTPAWYSVESYLERWRELSRAPITSSGRLSEYVG